VVPPGLHCAWRNVCVQSHRGRPRERPLARRPVQPRVERSDVAGPRWRAGGRASRGAAGATGQARGRGSHSSVPSLHRRKLSAVTLPFAPVQPQARQRATRISPCIPALAPVQAGGQSRFAPAQTTWTRSGPCRGAVFAPAQTTALQLLHASVAPQTTPRGSSKHDCFQADCGGRRGD